jgi:hypothetical protein
MLAEPANRECALLGEFLENEGYFNVLQSLGNCSRVARSGSHDLDRVGFCVRRHVRLASSGPSDRRRFASGRLPGMLADGPFRSHPYPAKRRRRATELMSFRRRWLVGIRASEQEISNRGLARSQKRGAPGRRVAQIGWSPGVAAISSPPVPACRAGAS